MDLGALLKGKKILITGASSGLGQHFAKLCANHGAHLCLAARRLAALESLSSELLEAGAPSVDSFSLDVTNAENIADVVTQTNQSMGGIDILVNNAGISSDGRAMDMSLDDFDRVMDTNLRGVWLMAVEVARAMRDTGTGGSIINIASVLGLRVAPGLAPYNISKAGVVQLTRTLAIEWARFNIRVNALAPGYFKTEINSGFLESEMGQKMLTRVPMRRTGEYHELDGAFLLLASKASSFMTGSILSVDGGHAISSV